MSLCRMRCLAISDTICDTLVRSLSCYLFSIRIHCNCQIPMEQAWKWSFEVALNGFSSDKDNFIIALYYRSTYVAQIKPIKFL